MNLLFFVILVSVVDASSHDPYHIDSSSFEEYDFSILDPNTASGFPFGGFSRATKSRLAKLPLHLPDFYHHYSGQGNDEKGIEASLEPFYMEATDSDGQKFVCRVYHEDELSPDSLLESMFHPPRFKSKLVLDEHQEQGDLHTSRELPQVGQAAIAVNLAAKKGIADLSPEELDKLIREDKIVQTQVQLAELEGVCAQIHKGWWSYEWCFETTVSQFHVNVDDASGSRPKHGQVRVESVSSLGKFNSRTTLVEDLDKLPPNTMLYGRREMARVVDEYRDGQLCAETGEKRKTFVNMQCCGKSFMEKTGGLLHKNGNRINSGLAAVANIDEKPLCTYNVTICTPLLCEPENDNSDAGQAIDGSSVKSSGEIAAIPISRDDVNNGGNRPASVRSILQRALGSRCIQGETGGWWTYEFCHGRSVRQYHETIATRKTGSGAVIMSKTLESEHILGLYDPQKAEAYPDEDWRFVVNVTNSDSGKTVSIGGGNGAYWELEYTAGDVCDHSDVTDAAVIAGSAGAGGVERASSVRYYCGNLYSLAVNEDSTCHYVVHVTLPDLCTHPLFMAPVAKKQVVKCLRSH